MHQLLLEPPVNICSNCKQVQVGCYSGSIWCQICAHWTGVLLLLVALGVLFRWCALLSSTFLHVETDVSRQQGHIHVRIVHGFPIPWSIPLRLAQIIRVSLLRRRWGCIVSEPLKTSNQHLDCRITYDYILCYTWNCTYHSLHAPSSGSKMLEVSALFHEPISIDHR